MAWQQSDLDSIRATIAAGILETRFADGRVTRWQSLADLLAAEQRIAGVLAASAPGAAASRLRLPAYRNGA